MNELSLLDSIFNNVLCDAEASGSCYYSPRVDVKEEEKAYTLEMELPGKSEEDINIQLDHNNLTISSKTEEKKDEKKKDEKSKYILKERRASQFERRFRLPEDVNLEEINANFKNGLLIINMQKKAAAAPRRISIQAC